MLSTQRLEIRPFQLSDAAAFFSLTQDAGFTAFPITDYRQKDLASSKAWIHKALEQNQKTKLGKWAVWENNELIGIGGLTPWTWEDEELVDITYRLKTSAQGRGLGKELGLALVEFGKKLPLTATITPDNLLSIKLSLQLGFRYDRRIQLLGVATELYRL